MDEEIRTMTNEMLEREFGDRYRHLISNPWRQEDDVAALES
jgi:hypothetical protein